MSTDSRDEAIREAKRYVREVVRNDWSFEFSTKPGAPPPTYPANPEPEEVLEWRLREYDSSGSELEPQFSPMSPSSPSGLLASGLTSPSASERRADRRRKRRRQLEDEMSWNEGLCTWVERRDAWTGAKSKAQATEQKKKDVDPQARNTTSTITAAAVAPGAATETMAALNIGDNEEQRNGVADPSSEQQYQDAGGEAAVDQSENPSKPSTETSIREPDSAPAPAAEDFHDPLIPVVSSLIANSNPIRASITSAMYPSIYSKVVIQGLTPTVPINLADMTKAMVQGWKADGQWPPKPTSIVLPDDSIIRTANSATKHPDTPAMITGAPDRQPSSPESKRRSGIASTVRKVLHFSGFHPHPFHRRSSSSQNPVQAEDPAAGVGEGTSHASINQPEP